MSSKKINRTFLALMEPPVPQKPHKHRRIKRRYLLGALFVLGFTLINAPWIFAWIYRVYYRPISRLPQANLAQTDHLLVLSPHPDDETLACGGLIQQVLAAGGRVSIVWITSGDGFEWDVIFTERTPRPQGKASLELGKRRMQEAKAAAKALGVAEENLYFLGYPDRGLLSLLLENYATPYRSRLTGVDAVPYEGTVSLGAAYTGANLERDFKTVLDQTNPSLILCPSPRDAHPDHKATADLAIRVLTERNELEKARYWVVHGGLEWPLPKGLHRDLPLEPPSVGKGMNWQRLVLDSGEQQKKLEALRAHGSQMELLSRFMLAFVRQNELFSDRPLP